MAQMAIWLFVQDGKYLIVKDPNKQLLRLYDIPDNTFDSEDSEESSEEGRRPRHVTVLTRNSPDTWQSWHVIFWVDGPNRCYMSRRP